MYILKKIMYYPRMSLEKSLKEVMKSKNKMIAGKYAPIVFGMDYEELSYTSLDGIQLYGWLIKRSDSSDTIIMLHGRNNNRIFCMKYLQVIADIDKNKKYNIFIPDLRNSGKSDKAYTAFGYYFARDIYASMLFLKKEYNLNNFILYGFSQGAMGASICTYLYKDMIKENGIKINKMILDSPVSNIKEIIADNATVFGFNIPYFTLIPSFMILNRIIDGKLNEMRLSTTLGYVETLILQSKKDSVTNYSTLLREYNKLKNREKNEDIKKTNFKIFRKGQHVRIYLEYKQEYSQTIQNFLESGDL